MAGVASASSPYTRTANYSGQQVFFCHDELNLDLHEYDMWGEGGASIGTYVRAITAAKNQELRDAGCTVTINDVEEYISSIEKRDAVARSEKEATWHTEYHNAADTAAWWADLGNSSSLVEFTSSIGIETHLGNVMPGVKITAAADPSSVPKFYWQCGIHAREWISGATCMYMAEKFVSQYGVDAEITELLDNSEILIVPLANPDGYEFTWSNDRLWRKNRRDNGSTNGVDCNRNYPDHWGEGGSSTLPSSDTYRGPSAASEPEVQNTLKFFKENAPILGAIDWHAYSQLVLRPYGWTRDTPPDEAYLKEIGDGMRDAIRANSGKVYVSQKSIDLYVTTGTASDWFYGEDAISTNAGYKPAGYCIELRPENRLFGPGFVLPAEEIIPTGEENYDAMVYFMQALLERPILA